MRFLGSVPSPVFVAVARDNVFVVIAGKKIIKNDQEIVIISGHYITVLAIQVDIVSAVGNRIPDVNLFTDWAKSVLVAKDTVNGDLVAHVVQIVVSGVLHDWPQGRVFLKLSIEIVLPEVLHMLDSNFTGSEWIG